MGGRGSKGKPRNRPEEDSPAPREPAQAEREPREAPDRPPDRQAQIQSQVIAGIRWLMKGDPGNPRESGEFVSITELRRLTGVPRAELDAELDRMYRAQEINLIPQSAQRTLTAEDREAAIRVGAENKHLISLGSKHRRPGQ